MQDAGLTREFITYVCNQVLMKRGGYKTVLNSIRTDQFNVVHDSVADLTPLNERLRTMDQKQRQALAERLYVEGRDFLDFLSINGVSGYYFSSSITKLTPQDELVFDGLAQTTKGHCVVAENLDSIRSLTKLCTAIDPTFTPPKVKTQPKKLVQERIVVASHEDIAAFLATEPLYEGNGKHFLQAFDVYLRLLNKKDISGIKTNYTLALLAKILVAKMEGYPIGAEGKLTDGNRSLSRLELQALYALDWTVIQCEQMINVTEANSFDICKALAALPDDVNYSNYETYYNQIIDLVEKSAVQDNIEKDLVDPSDETIKAITKNINSNGGNITEDKVAEIVANKGYMSSVLSSIKNNAGKITAGAIVLGTIGAIVYLRYVVDNDSKQDSISSDAPLPGPVSLSSNAPETSILTATVDAAAKIVSDYIPGRESLSDLGSKLQSFIPDFSKTFSKTPMSPPPIDRSMTNFPELPSMSSIFSSAFSTLDSFVGKIIPRTISLPTEYGATSYSPSYGTLTGTTSLPFPSDGPSMGTAVPFLNPTGSAIPVIL